MIKTIIIRKHLFTESIDSRYFGTFQNLLELDLDEETVMCLFDFFEKYQKLKMTKIALYPSPAITRIKTHTSTQSPLYGFFSAGVSNMSIFTDGVQKLTEWQEFHTSLTGLNSKLGWSHSEFKKIDVDIGDFIEDTAEFAAYPASFSEIDSLWEQAIPL